MTSTTAFLRHVPVLAGLPDEQLEQVAAKLSERSFRAGEWIFHEGDSAASMFILRTGRVAIVAPGPPETLIRVLRRGAVLGELALLRQGVRSASARAGRDVELLELDRATFEGLIVEAPAFALGLTRVMGAQLAASRSAMFTAPQPQTVAVVGLHEGAPVGQVGELLERALAGHGSVVQLREGTMAAVDQAERDLDRVVLTAIGGVDDHWTQLVVREADVVVAVTRRAMDPEWLSRADALRGCELLSVDFRVPSEMLASLAPHGTQVLAAADLPQAVEVLGRRFTGRALGIVFSGGGARALAHLGVFEELLAAGLHFDRVAGVSLGSLVAAAVAAGFPVEEIYERFEVGLAQRKPTSDYGPPIFSLIRGAKTRQLLADAFGDRRIEELALRFFCLSCDLIAREPVIHRTGLVRDAVYPSLSIPGVFPPVATADGRLLVDGGVLDNLPVATMASTGEGPVIAVDVTGRAGESRRAQRPRLRRATRAARRLLTGSEIEIPRLAETIVRTVMVGSTDTVASARTHADLVITPAADGVGLMDWEALPHVRELGRRAARQALSANPEILRSLGA